MLPPAMARKIKGRSSHLLREEFPQLKRMPSFWTRRTFYSTAGKVSSEIMERYLAQQATQERKRVETMKSKKRKQTNDSEDQAQEPKKRTPTFLLELPLVVD